MILEIHSGQWALMLSTSEYSPGANSTTHDQWLGRPAISYLTFSSKDQAINAKTSLEQAKIGGLTVVALFKE